ncbi:MAG: hypothetical protein LBN37_07050 [Bacteroidales bacterium]|jgi:hypothetical protein|nr:hypothetical protein [Bacteroidales bacterium]
MKKMKFAKNALRILRVMRLLALCDAYSAYTMMLMYSTLCKHGTTYKEAENMYNSFSALFTGMPMSVENFLHTDEELANNVLDEFNKLNKAIEDGEKLGLNADSIKAFCKQVEHNPYYSGMKFYGTLYYHHWLEGLLSYLLGKTSKTKLLEDVWVEYSLWATYPSKSKRRGNLYYFRQMMNRIDNLYFEIALKRVVRNVNKK